MSKCSIHPKYDGKKEPEVECVGCLAWHLHVTSGKKKVYTLPTKKYKNSQKYERKKYQKDVW